jgi:kinesin family protein C1
MSTTLKRKINNEDEGLPPRKLTAISEYNPQQPLRPSKTATNLIPTISMKPSITIPKSISFATKSTRRANRATSAPPKGSASTSRIGSSTSRVPPGRVPIGRTVSASHRPPEDHRFQHQNSSIESARTADATARLAVDMEAERVKVSQLQKNHMVLSRELAAAKQDEIFQRRELLNFTDELENIKKEHEMEITDLESTIRQRDRKVQELEHNLRACADDLMRERNQNSVLNATISEQSTAHVALSAKIGALQVRLSAVQSSSDTNSSSASHYRLKLEAAEERVGFLENEVREAEMIRRRLHNMVQELKGNIRVFARVRPPLASDFSSSNPEDHADALARVEFPDKRDHKEIALTSYSESATGQERKETWRFTFDRVCVLCFSFNKVL